MTYVLIVNGAVSEYPYYLRDLRADNPDTSFPSVIPDTLLAEYGVYPVTQVEPPVPNITQNTMELDPVLVGGVWTENWTLVAASAEEIAARQQMLDDQAAVAEVKADAFVTNYLAMTPAQLATYIENNTANVSQIRALLKKMAWILLVVGRRTDLR